MSIGNCVRYRKKAGIVTIIGNSDGGITLPKFDAAITLGVLPEDCTPITDILTTGTSKSASGYLNQIRIYKTGQISIANLNPNTTSSYWGFTISFPVK